MAEKDPLHEPAIIYGLRYFIVSALQEPCLSLALPRAAFGSQHRYDHAAHEIASINHSRSQNFSLQAHVELTGILHCSIRNVRVARP
jgi:hypothetical protein